MNSMSIKLVPSETGGAALVKHGRSLTRIRLSGGRDALGIVLPRYDRSTIERLLAAGYVARLEIEGADLLHSRAEIQEISRLIGLTALETAFARDVQREVDRVMAGRRGLERGSTANAPAATARALLAGFKTARKGAADAAASLVRSLDTELMGRVDRLVRSDSTGALLKRFREIVERFATRSEIPEYAALVILELVNNLQVQTMHNFAQRSKMSAEKIRSLYQNPTVRGQIRRLMERQGETSSIGWSFVTHAGSGARTTEVTVTMTGRGAPMRAFSTEVEEKRRVAVGERSIQEFYNGLGESVFNIDLGLYYLSYLEELCRKSGMRFATRVRETGNQDEMMIALRIDL